MTVAYEKRKQSEASAADGSDIGPRLGDQWPKVAVVFAIVLTVAWVIVLAWSATFVLDLI
jgi:hypothetical protein